MLRMGRHGAPSSRRVARPHTLPRFEACFGSTHWCQHCWAPAPRWHPAPKRTGAKMHLKSRCCLQLQARFVSVIDWPERRRVNQNGLQACTTCTTATTTTTTCHCTDCTKACSDCNDGNDSARLCVIFMCMCRTLVGCVCAHHVPTVAGRRTSGANGNGSHSSDSLFCFWNIW